MTGGLWFSTITGLLCWISGEGREVKTFGLALVFSVFATLTLAGGIEPVMDPGGVETAAASSANDNWVGIALTVLLLGTALN